MNQPSTVGRIFGLNEMNILNLCRQFASLIIRISPVCILPTNIVFLSIVKYCKKLLVVVGCPGVFCSKLLNISANNPGSYYTWSSPTNIDNH